MLLSTVPCGIYEEKVSAKEEAGMKEPCWTRKGEKQRCERRWNQVLIAWLSVSPRSQAARGKEKEKDGTTDSGIKLEPVPGLPGGECRFCLPSSWPPADTHTALTVWNVGGDRPLLAAAVFSSRTPQDFRGVETLLHRGLLL